MGKRIVREDGAPSITLVTTLGGAAAEVAGALATVVGQVDEIIALDGWWATGDLATVAAGLGAEIVPVATEDEAVARQTGFDRARGDWVIWLEPNERLMQAHMLRETVADAPADVDRLRVRTGEAVRETLRPVAYGWEERVFRNDGGVRWHGEVDPWPRSTPERRGRSERAWPIWVTREFDMARRIERARATLLPLERELASGPGLGAVADARRWRRYGRAHLDGGDLATAGLAFEAGLLVATDDDIRCLLALDQARVRLTQGDLERATVAFGRAATARPEWPLPWLGLARVAYVGRDWSRVVRMIERARECADPDPDDDMIETGPLQVEWLVQYTNALWWTGRLEEALWWTEFALGNDPDDAYHRANLRLFRERQPPGRLRAQNAGIIPGGRC